VLASTASTNDDARKLAAAGAPHGAVVIAEHQTAGRGRGSHRWHSPAGENIYLSVVWRPRLEFSRMALFALAAGHAILRVVDRQLGGERARIKWPNDVYVDDRKIAGVLAEAVVGGAQAVVILGVGLNVLASEFPGELGATATSLQMAGGRSIDRDQVAAQALFHIEHSCRSLERGEDATLVAELSRRDWLVGKSVVAGGLSGVAAGIASDGALRIRDAAGAVHCVVSGDVTLSVV
jgi:BirA family biotin operon repressor/biotin-[acetyl-CoA-carboxylase] ligase